MLLLLKFKKFKVEDSIIICGEPRSGTTWLLDIVSKIPKTCVHWEPFRQENGVVPKKWKWGDRIFIPKEDKNKKYYQLIKGVLSFKIYNKWTIERLSVKSLLKSERIVIKFIRANLLLPYFFQNFNVQNKPILVIRHPIDVSLSKMKAFSYNNIFPREIPDWLNNNRYFEEADYLQSLTSALEYNIALWCINNCPLLEDEDTISKLNIVFYSDLVLNPEKETRKIFNNLICVKKSDIDKIISSINFQKASGTDFKKDYIPNPKKQLQKNIKKLTQEEKERIQNIFDHFNFKLYDAYSVFPKKEYL